MDTANLICGGNSIVGHSKEIENPERSLQGWANIILFGNSKGQKEMATKPVTKANVVSFPKTVGNWTSLNIKTAGLSLDFEAKVAYQLEGLDGAYLLLVGTKWRFYLPERTSALDLEIVSHDPTEEIPEFEASAELLLVIQQARVHAFEEVADRIKHDAMNLQCIVDSIGFVFASVAAAEVEGKPAGIGKEDKDPDAGESEEPDDGGEDLEGAVAEIPAPAKPKTKPTNGKKPAPTTNKKAGATKGVSPRVHQVLKQMAEHDYAGAIEVFNTTFPNWPSNSEYLDKLQECIVTMTKAKTASINRSASELLKDLKAFRKEEAL